LNSLLATKLSKGLIIELLLVVECFRMKLLEDVSAFDEFKVWYVNNFEIISVIGK
jgi:hypothetical protein